MTYETRGFSCPSLATPRFQFRPFEFADLERLTSLAGEHRAADTITGIPHPFTFQFARMWLCSDPADWGRGRPMHWVVHRSGDHKMVGYAGLYPIDVARHQAELRFWVACNADRMAYALEWSRAIVDYAWAELDLSRIYAVPLARHPLAAQVLTELGMQQEGSLRKRIDKGGPVEDLCCWALWRRGAKAPPNRSVSDGTRQ